MMAYWPTLAQLLHNAHEVIASNDRKLADHILPLIVYKVAVEVREPYVHEKEVSRSNVADIFRLNRDNETVILNQFILVDHSAITLEVSKDELIVHTDRKPYGINMGMKFKKDSDARIGPWHKIGGKKKKKNVK